MNDLIKIIQNIVSQSVALKNKYINELTAPIEFVCIFCQNEKEYKEFTQEIEKFGKVVEETPTGFTYLLDKPIITTSGSLRLVKIRKPDSNHLERGDADFNTSDLKLKEKFINDPKFELIRRKNFEMLRLADPDFDVMTCFSNEPKSKSLGIRLYD